MLQYLIKALDPRAKQLKMKCIRKGMEAEVTYTDSKNRQWRFPVNLLIGYAIVGNGRSAGNLQTCIIFMGIIGGDERGVD
jgi:hypothetical protein